MDEGALTKLTVSNFITPPFARYSEALRAISPPGCAHLYFTSCLDEMVDKSIRALKHKRPEAQVVVSFEGARIGGNTAAGRSLSDCEKHFDWPSLPHPNRDPAATIERLDQLLEAHGGAEKLIGVYLEAIQAGTGDVLTDEAWELICAWRDRTGVPIVLSEVSSGFGRSGRGFWWLSGAQSQADVVLWWAGGQIGHIFSSPSTFVSKPLTLISTWDGDELSATRILWQLFATREVLKSGLAELSSRLDQILRGVFGEERLGGVGLYRTVRTSRAVELLAALRESGVQIQRIGDRLCFAPPLTTTDEEMDRFERLLMASSR
jgi:adenosylmethionine-8-amino-7-oxononanoate aminotransferase